MRRRAKLGVGGRESWKRHGWGWGIVWVVGALIAVDGVWLFSAVGSPAVFEQDTGVQLAAVQQAFPDVAAQMEQRGRLLALMLTGLGVFVLVLAWAGLKSDSRYVWNSLWVLVLLFAGIGAYVMTSGRADIASFYLGVAVLTAVGLLWAGRGLPK